MQNHRFLFLLCTAVSFSASHLLLAQNDFSSIPSFNGANFNDPQSASENKTIQNFNEPSKPTELSEPDPFSSLSLTTASYLTTAAVAADSFPITVGGYITFLKATASKENTHELYSDAMESQILRSFGSDHDDYVMVVGVNLDDPMLCLTALDMTYYNTWVETYSPSWHYDKILTKNSSPLMMFVEGEKTPGASKPDPKTSGRSDDRRVASGGSSQVAQGDASNFSLIEAATQAADHARENLDVEKMPGGDSASRDSKIRTATEASTIADMLSSYVSDSVAKKRAAHDETPLFLMEREKKVTTLQQAAAWEATVNESLFTAKSSLATATKNHTDTQSNLEELQAAVTDSANIAKEALNKRADAVANVKSGALQTGGAALCIAFANPGPLVAEGVSLGIAAGGAALAHLDVRKTDAEVAAATASLKYATAKIAILGKIKAREEELHAALLSLKEQASCSVETTFGAMVGSGANAVAKQRELISLRQAATDDMIALRTTHAEQLTAWAADNLLKIQAIASSVEEVVRSKQAALDIAVRNYEKASIGKAEKELDTKIEAEVELKKAQINLSKSQRAITAVEHYNIQAKGILEALKFHHQLAKIKEETLNDLQEAKMHKTSLESALHAAREEHDQANSIYKATSTISSLLYPEKKRAENTAAIKSKKCEADVKQATLALAQAESVAQSATQNLAAINARLNIWDNLRAWHTVAIAASQPVQAGEKLEEKSISTDSSLYNAIGIAKDTSELDDKGIHAISKKSEQITKSTERSNLNEAISSQLKTTQLGHLAADFSEELQRRQEAFEAGKHFEPVAMKENASSNAPVGIDDKLDKKTSQQLMAQHAAIAALQTGDGVEAAIDRYFSVAMGDPFPKELASSSALKQPANDINAQLGAVVTSAIITRERFNVVDETTVEAQNALAAYQQAEKERKQRLVDKMNRLKK